MGTGTGPSMPSPYASAQPPAGNGTYGGGAPPPGFEGMASPYYPGSGTTTTTGGGKQEISRKSFNLTVGMRVAAILLSLVSLCLIAAANRSDSAVFVTATGTEYWIDRKALRVRASRFLVAMAAIVLLYEVVQIVLSCLDTTRAITFMSSYAGLLSTFVADQLLAYLVFAAAATAADFIAGYRHKDGTAEAWGCTGWGSWCSQVEAGVAMGYFAFAALALLAIISGARFNKFS